MRACVCVCVCERERERERERESLAVGERCNIFNVGDCVSGCVGVVLAVNVETAEGRNMSDRIQKRCFILFVYVLPLLW